MQRLFYQRQRHPRRMTPWVFPDSGSDGPNKDVLFCKFVLVCLSQGPLAPGLLSRTELCPPRDSLSGMPGLVARPASQGAFRDTLLPATCTPGGMGHPGGAVAQVQPCGGSQTGTHEASEGPCLCRAFPRETAAFQAPVWICWSWWSRGCAGLGDNRPLLTPCQAGQRATRSLSPGSMWGQAGQSPSKKGAGVLRPCWV